MSNHTVEAFMHRVANDRSIEQAFLDNPDSVLDRFPLSDEERRQILEWDLHAIVDSGVSPMVLMLAYFATHGGHSAREEYVRILREPPVSAAGQGN